MMVVVWLALIVYTYLDATRRISDPVLVACATIGSLFPYIGTARLCDRAPAGVPRGRPRARAGDPRGRAEGAPAHRGLLPELRIPGREELPALPELPAPAQGPLSDLQQAGRSALGALSLLRRPAAGGRGRASRRAKGLAAQHASEPPPRRNGAAAAAEGPRGAGDPRLRAPPGRGASARRGEEARPDEPQRSPAREPDADPRKADAFERALTGEVIARFERKGLRIAALKTMRADEPIANEHYAEHTEKPFFGELVSFITGGPLVAMVLEGTRSGRGGAAADRRDQPGRGRARLDPRRLRARGDLQHGPRLRLG